MKIVDLLVRVLSSIVQAFMLTLITSYQSDQLRELKQVLEVNTRLKKLMAELSLDKSDLPALS